MNKKILAAAIAGLLIPALLAGQTRTETAYKKGTFYAFWGWNRAAYSNSDIHFKGNDYDFTLYRVKAHDRPTPFSYHNYFQIDRITIPPQTNFKIGYFFKDNMAINIGGRPYEICDGSESDSRYQWLGETGI